jgi:hypothetical protein
VTQRGSIGRLCSDLGPAPLRRTEDRPEFSRLRKWLGALVIAGWTFDAQFRLPFSDRFFICDTWHHIGGHAKYLALLKRMLKPGGQVIMVDFKKARSPVGPPTQVVPSQPSPRPV